MKQYLWALSLLFCLAPVWASVDVYEFSSDENYDRFRDLTEELRCPKCQNQNIADSDAQIAQDLRQEVHRLVEEGQSNDEVVQYMVERYGEFVRYSPSLSGITLGLWLAPFVLLGLSLPLLLLWIRRRNRGIEAAEDEDS